MLSPYQLANFRSLFTTETPFFTFKKYGNFDGDAGIYIPRIFLFRFNEECIDELHKVSQKGVFGNIFKAMVEGITEPSEQTLSLYSVIIPRKNGIKFSRPLNEIFLNLDDCLKKREQMVVEKIENLKEIIQNTYKWNSSKDNMFRDREKRLTRFKNQCWLHVLYNGSFQLVHLPEGLNFEDDDTLTFFQGSTYSDGVSLRSERNHWQGDDMNKTRLFPLDTSKDLFSSVVPLLVEYHVKELNKHITQLNTLKAMQTSSVSWKPIEI